MEVCYLKSRSCIIITTLQHKGFALQAAVCLFCFVLNLCFSHKRNTKMNTVPACQVVVSLIVKNSNIVTQKKKKKVKFMQEYF